MEPHGPWLKVMEDGAWILEQCRFGEHRLPCDWVSYSGGKVAGPAAGWESRFGFEAVRIPLYLGLSGLEGQVRPVIGFWQSYFAKGETPPAWVDVRSGAVAEYGLSYGAATCAAVLANAEMPATTPVQHDYYSGVLKCFSSLLPKQT